MIGLGLAVSIFSGAFLTSTPVFADSFFKDVLKISGTFTKKTGEAMDELGEKRKDSFIGTGLKIGGKVNKAVGTVVEQSADDLDKKEAR